MNELFINDVHSSYAVSGRLKLSLRFFSRIDSGDFTELLNVDSIYNYKKLQLTKKNIHILNDEICAIAKDVNAAHKDIKINKLKYSFEQLLKLDSLEHLTIPIYTRSAPTMGIYKDYAHFKLSTPNDNSEIIVDTSNSKAIKVYKIYKAKNRKIKLESEGIYAVSNGDKLYKATSHQFYEIKKDDKGFFYDRPASLSNGPTLWYRFRINSLKGNAIPIYEIEPF